MRWMTGFSLEKKPQGPKVLETVKSEVFICVWAVRHDFNVGEMGSAVKVVFGDMLSHGDEGEWLFSLPSFRSLCSLHVPSSLRRYIVHWGPRDAWMTGGVALSRTIFLSCCHFPPASQSTCLFIASFVYSIYNYSFWAFVWTPGKEWDERKFSMNWGYEPWPDVPFFFIAFYPFFWDIVF